MCLLLREENTGRKRTVGRSDYLKHGDPNAICDVCGFKYKLSQLKKRWDNLMVCPEDFEVRQPQDYVRGVRDQRSIPDARPEAPDVFVTGFVTTPVGATVITVGASPFTFTNPTSLPLSIEVNDGSVSSITVNSIQQSTTSNVIVVLPRGQSMTVTYTIAPTMFYGGQ